ncbi:MAG: carboxypeptidase-like regulatory domain-containing protein [Candidatus Hydrogenedentes bacterium]|nr:carboxypeptidase-like regulatory domain-containing protein [Candidatus Hydrogenedentota bacterium]
MNIIAGLIVAATSLSPESFTVEGCVRVAGAPADGVSVWIRDELSSARSVTDAKGNYRVAVSFGGMAQLEFTREQGESDRSTLRQLQTLVLMSGTASQIDVDLNPGAGAVEGVLTHNGAPVASGSALLTSHRANAGTYTICTLADENGAYRIDGLSAGKYKLELDPRPTTLRVAMAQMRQPAAANLVIVKEGQAARHDFNLRTGEIIARLSGMGIEEVGRLVVVPGEFAGPVLTEATAQAMLRRAIVTIVVENDKNVEVPDLEEGTYAVFFAAFDRASGSLRSAFKAMRVTYVNVVVRADAPASLTLHLP